MLTGIIVLAIAAVVGIAGSLVSVARDGTTTGAVLGLAHPGGAWLEWL